MIKGDKSIKHDAGNFDAGRATVYERFTLEERDAGSLVTLGNNKRYTIRRADAGKVINHVTVTNYDHANAVTVDFWQFENVGDDIRARHNSK